MDLLRKEPAAVRKARELDGRREPKVLAAPVLYEVMAGLLFTRSRSEAAAFARLAAGYVRSPFGDAAASQAAEIRAERMRLGRVKSHLDGRIAGMAGAGRRALVSRDPDLREIGKAVGLWVDAYGAGWRHRARGAGPARGDRTGGPA